MKLSGFVDGTVDDEIEGIHLGKSYLNHFNNKNITRQTRGPYTAPAQLWDHDIGFP